MLIPCREGQYRFLPGIDAYSSGVVATLGHEIVHATLQALVPYREGFALIDGHLRALGRPRAALCAIELRIPQALSFAGFADFNRGYRTLLEEWGLLVDGRNPVARTNVAPMVGAPAWPALYGFSYTVPAPGAADPTFVVAGAGELRAGVMGPEGVVRRGESSTEALREKATHVMDVMVERLRGLEGAWEAVTAVDVYTPHPIAPILTGWAGAILGRLGPAAVHGVRWYPSHPPIAGLEFEMDLRGVRHERYLRA
jgi:hypothetical protein